MRDFNFNGDANTSAANIAGVRPAVEEFPPAAKIDETLSEENLEHGASLRDFHADVDDDESSNFPKIVGAAVVGILIVGGGLYAYESSTANKMPAPKITAMKTPTPVNQADNVPAMPLPAAPAPVSKSVTRSASETPAPPPQQPVKQAAVTPGVGIGPSNDPAIDAPMSFTADNAPPPQQPDPSSQIAASGTAPSDQALLQQPITAPNIPGADAQPGSAVAAAAPQQHLLQPAIQPPQ